MNPVLPALGGAHSSSAEELDMLGLVLQWNPHTDPTETAEPCEGGLIVASCERMWSAQEPVTGLDSSWVSLLVLVYLYLDELKTSCCEMHERTSICQSYNTVNP